MCIPGRNRKKKNKEEKPDNPAKHYHLLVHNPAAVRASRFVTCTDTYVDVRRFKTQNSGMWLKKRICPLQRRQLCAVPPSTGSLDEEHRRIEAALHQDDLVALVVQQRGLPCDDLQIGIDATLVADVEEIE